MYGTHSLLLNEEAYKVCPDAKKSVFIYEWLRYLDRILPVTQRSDVKNVQLDLLKQLESRLTSVIGPPTRHLLARCIARVLLLGNSSSLVGIVDRCNEILRTKEDTSNIAASKLAALSCLAALYESAGRMVGETYKETFHIIQKSLKLAESQTRSMMITTLGNMVKGLGVFSASLHKEIYKIAKTCIQDRAQSVKVAAVECLTALVPFLTQMYTLELESTCTICVKVFDGANCELRFLLSRFVATLLKTALEPPSGAVMGGRTNQGVIVQPAIVEEILQLLSSAFLKGGISGFLRGSSSSSATPGGQKDVRIGIAMAYVEMVRDLGSSWLERNISVICSHLVDLAAKSGHLAFTTNEAQITEALTMRRCVSYIFRSTIGTMLGEHAQLTACKHLGALLVHYLSTFDCTVVPGVEQSLSIESHASSYAANVILLELSVLVRLVGTAVTPLFVEASGIMESVFACLLHPILETRIITAWCLRCVTIGVPSQLTPLIDRCISRLERMKTCPGAINGYSVALSSLITASGVCNLGIPHAKPQQVLSCAEELLKTATQQSNLVITKIEAGWNLLHALVSLGSSVIKDHMPQIIRHWCAAFPRSVREAETEKTKGDSFSWCCTMTAHAGALSVMCAVANQPDLLALDNLVQTMILPLECSLIFMAHVGELVRSYGSRMRQLNGLIRIRVYNLLLLLPVKRYESLYVSLLRELVADITLSDNAQCTLVTSVPLASSGVERVLLSPWFGNTDQAMIEDLVQSYSSDIGSMENDITSVFSTTVSIYDSLWPESNSIQLQCLDLAIQTYGKVFPMVSSKHKIQITEHFTETVKGCKNVARQHAVHLNSITATMLAFKVLCEQRCSRIENESLQKASIALIVPALSNSESVIRFVGAEALARLAQAVGAPEFVASMAQYCFDKLRICRDAPSRAGHALALGCLHRHVGSLGSGQHLNTGVCVVLALVQDTNYPTVQSWALISMALIAETGGGMFRGFVESVLSVCLKLLLSTPSSNVEVLQGVGKLLTALITSVGPELGCAGLIDGVRASLLAACAIQIAHQDPTVCSEAISGLQQMHLFAPRYVNLGYLVVDICTFLKSQHLSIRKASVCCLRQLVQREAKEVREHSQVLVPQSVVDENRNLPLPDTGLEGALFSMLDVEIDIELRAHVQETLISLVQGTSSELLNNWLLLCKEILATSNDSTRSILVPEEKNIRGANGADEDEEDGDDDTTLAGVQSISSEKGKLVPRWATKVFAMEIVQRLMNVCDAERAHLDLKLAKELQIASGGRSDYLVLHLADLVRMSFMAATSDSSQLRLAGLQSLQDVISRFSTVPEPEFPGHVILEQFQAQVGAALRPAFADDTPSHITAAACQVCSTWIGSGVARDLNDLRRVHQLLVSSLSKLRSESSNTQLYNESAATLEKLSILKAWAEIYVTAVRQNQQDIVHDVDYEDSYNTSCHDSLLSLVCPELDSLVVHWLCALRDAALLALPHHYDDQILTGGGAFFIPQSIEVCREYYRKSWPPILLATATWLQTKNFVLPTTTSRGSSLEKVDKEKDERFYLLLGLAVESLSSRTSNFDDDTIQIAVKTITCLISCEWCQLHLMSNVTVAIEVLNVLHRLILTRDNLTTQLLCIECGSAIANAACAAMTQSCNQENSNVETELSISLPRLFCGNEGGLDGDIVHPFSSPTISFAVLELCLCTIARQMPQIRTSFLKQLSMAPLHVKRVYRHSTESTHIIIRCINLLAKIPSLCSPMGRLSCLPVSIYFLVFFIRESAIIDSNHNLAPCETGHLTTIAIHALQALRTIVVDCPTDESITKWKIIVRSAFHSLLLLPEEDTRIDECVVMLSCVLVATSAPADVVLGSDDSLSRFVSLIKRQIGTQNVQVTIKALQSMNSMMSCKQFTGIFVRNLGKDVLKLLEPYVLTSAGNSCQFTDVDVVIVQEAIKTFEILTTLANKKRRIRLVSFLVQLLVRLLRAKSSDEWRQLSTIDRKIHEVAISRLNASASHWPLEFKQILNWNAELKSTLEGAMQLQSSRRAMSNVARNKDQENSSSTTTSQHPRIKLIDLNTF